MRRSIALPFHDLVGEEVESPPLTHCCRRCSWVAVAGRVWVTQKGSPTRQQPACRSTVPLCSTAAASHTPLADTKQRVCPPTLPCTATRLRCPRPATSVTCGRLRCAWARTRFVDESMMATSPPHHRDCQAPHSGITLATHIVLPTTMNGYGYRGVGMPGRAPMAGRGRGTHASSLWLLLCCVSLAHVRQRRRCLRG